MMSFVFFVHARISCRLAHAVAYITDIRSYQSTSPDSTECKVIHANGSVGQCESCCLRAVGARLTQRDEKVELAGISQLVVDSEPHLRVDVGVQRHHQGGW